MIGPRTQTLSTLTVLLISAFTSVVYVLLTLINVGTMVIGLLIFLLPIALYFPVIRILGAIIRRNSLLLKFYWGKSYLNGLWSYAYYKENDPSGKLYSGVWRFTQDAYKTRVEGFGLNDRFEIRSRVKSVTDLLANGDVHEIINIRYDTLQVERDNYSKTSISFEPSDFRKSFIKYPTRFTSRTIILGGTLTGDVHRDVFIRHEYLKSEEDVISFLRDTIAIEP